MKIWDVGRAALRHLADEIAKADVTLDYTLDARSVEQAEPSRRVILSIKVPKASLAERYEVAEMHLGATMASMARTIRDKGLVCVVPTKQPPRSLNWSNFHEFRYENVTMGPIGLTVVDHPDDPSFSIGIVGLRSA